MLLPRLIVVLLLAGTAGLAGVRHVAGAAPSPSAPPSDAAQPPAEAAAEPAPSCVPPGVWADGRGAALDRAALLERAARAPAVLLGERHDSAEHHRWQLQTLTELYARNPNLAIGLEMMPRARQAALDRWVEGRTDEAQFLRETDWRTVWGYDPQLYLPILHFARMNRVPLVALNVELGLVRRTGQEGWAAVPEAEREGVGAAAAPSGAYLDFLAGVMEQHGPAVDRSTPRFRNFVEAQSVWDRAMAERIAETHRSTGRTVVAIVGAGHVQNRFGIPHQLADLGVADPLVLLAWDAARPCAELDGTIADAVFGLSPIAEAAAPSAPPRPRLGVMMEAAEGGAKVARVTDGSVAAAAGLKAGDVIVSAAGRPVSAPGDLTAIVQRQAPGTWLPVTVQRGGKPRELVAKFPAE